MKVESYKNSYNLFIIFFNICAINFVSGAYHFCIDSHIEFNHPLSRLVTDSVRVLHYNIPYWEIYASCFIILIACCFWNHKPSYVIRFFNFLILFWVVTFFITTYGLIGAISP